MLAGAGIRTLADVRDLATIEILQAEIVRGELGVLYAYWNGVNSLDNGMGVLGGVQFGFFWIKGNNKAAVTITPQLSYDGKSWLGFLTVGFSVTNSSGTKAIRMPHPECTRSSRPNSASDSSWSSIWMVTSPFGPPSSMMQRSTSPRGTH